MLTLSLTKEWKETHPEASIGLLEISGVDNAQSTSLLDEHKRRVEESLRAAYGHLSRQELLTHPILSAYKEYYSRFKKTYHIQLQVESIAQKGKKLPRVSPLVDVNFIAEMETFTLTAGHDLEKLKKPVIIDISKEGDQIIQMNGKETPMRTGDMVMRDAEGISCSIIYGQDNRSFITPSTTHALYVLYAPKGISDATINEQFAKIERYTRLFAPNAVTEQKTLLKA